jgi:hypothetical protein
MISRRRPSAKHCLKPARRLNRRAKNHARGYLFSAKGAGSFAAWGNAPGTRHTQNKNSAESAIHPENLSDESNAWDDRNSQVSRAFSAAGVRACFPAALPQAGHDVAPLALSVQLSRLAAADSPPRSHGLTGAAQTGYGCRDGCASRLLFTGPWHKGLYKLPQRAMAKSEKRFRLVFAVEGRLERLVLHCMFVISWRGDVIGLRARPAAAVRL